VTLFVNNCVFHVFVNEGALFFIMGKLSKPQRSKKHKKLKAVDPFYTGNRPVEK